MTPVVTEAVLFAPFGSDVLVVAKAVFEMLVLFASASTVADTVIVTESPAARVPTSQGRLLHTFGEDVTAPKVMLFGGVSSTTTSLAADGPLLVTTMV